MRRTQIVGVGSYAPSNVVTNHDLEKLMETSDEWIQKRTGIQERRWVEPGEATSDLGVRAAERALDAANVSKEEIDLIIFATLSPDHEFPGTGCFFQAKLGVAGIPTLDIRQQCTGFVYGMSIADQFIRTGMYNKVLVVGAEVHSRGLEKTTNGRDVTVLFGDGGGAAVLASTEIKDPKADSHIWSTHLHADGRFAKELWVPAPGTAVGYENRADQAMLDEGLIYPKMNGKKVFTAAVRGMTEALVEAFKANSVAPESVDLFLFHQANMRINEAVAQQLKIPAEKVFNTIQKYGNTTAATLPIGMDEAIQAGKLEKGMLVGLAAFGSGFTWASGLVRF